MNLENLLKRYHEAGAKTFPGDWDPSYALSLLASEELCRQLDTLKPKSILELGSGSSSVVVRAWLKKHPDVVLVTGEHNPEWIVWVKEHLKGEGLEERTFKSMADVRAGKEKFDFCFVDHGPAMQTRLDDLSWIIVRCDHLVLDDWRTQVKPRHTQRVDRYLRSKGLVPVILEGSRSDPVQRALAYCKGLP